MNSKSPSNLFKAATALGFRAGQEIRRLHTPAEPTSVESPPREESGLEMQAREAVRSAYPWTEDPAGNPILIEAELHIDLIEVAMPDGTVAEFRLSGAWAAPCEIVIHIYPAVSRFANVFRRSAEGVHPFIGRAERVEGREA